MKARICNESDTWAASAPGTCRPLRSAARLSSMPTALAASRAPL
ncbi:hypothetical protein [Kitasatospora sp. NPDC050543]